MRRTRRLHRLVAPAALLLLASCRGSQVQSPSFAFPEPRPSIVRDFQGYERPASANEVVVTLTWPTPLPVREVALGMKGAGGWMPLAKRDAMDPHVGHFAIPAGRVALQFLLFKSAFTREPLRATWDGPDFDCEPGARLGMQIRTQPRPDGKVAGVATYASRGCRVPKGGDSQSLVLTLAADSSLLVLCCSDNRGTDSVVYACGGLRKPADQRERIPVGHAPPHVAGDHLWLTLFEGGCGTNHIQLCFRDLDSGSRQQVLLETRFHHTGRNCEAYIEEDSRIDLRVLKAQYLRAFEPPPKPVVLSIEGVG
jgi:hypothetical protein